MSQRPESGPLSLLCTALVVCLAPAVLAQATLGY
jgi:hypothetical protein